MHATVGNNQNTFLCLLCKYFISETKKYVDIGRTEHGLEAFVERYEDKQR